MDNERKKNSSIIQKNPESKIRDFLLNILFHY